MYCTHLFILITAGVQYINGFETTTTPAPDSEPSCQPRTNTGKLKKAVFCGYDSDVRPVIHHKDQIFVKMAIFPTDIIWISESRNQVWISFWIYLQWKDSFLTWNSSEYGGLDEFYTEGGKIWIPDIYISDPPQTQITKMATVNCEVHSDGYVDCTMNPGLTARCDIDLTYFPHDRHSCKLNFRPRSYKGSVLNLDFINTQGTDPFKFYRPHGSWNLLSLKSNRSVTALYDEVFTIDMEYTFIIERRSSTYNVIYAAPSFVMIMMVLSVFWLEVQSSARVILPGLAILSHLFIMLWLMQAIYANFEHLPVIIILFRDSLMMTGLALVWSVVARVLCSSSSSPFWLYTFTTSLNTNLLVKFLLPQDIFMKSGIPGDEEESSLVIRRDCVEQQWRILTTLTDRILFAIYLIAYMYFFMRLTP